LLFGIESSTTASLDAGAIEASAVEVSWASRKNKLSFFANDYGGSRLGLEIEATGTAAILKSFGTHTTTGRRRAVVTKTADYTAAATDEVIVCDKATAMTITLPAATGTGQWFAIGSIGAGAVTVDGSGADVIDGSATQVIYQYDTIQIVDYAAGAWKVI
jgi:hypothetical protein